MPIVDINGTPVEFPDDLTGDALNEAVGLAASQMGMAPQRGTGEKVARGVGLFGRGMNNALGAAAGALPDLVGAGLRAAGLPSSAPGQYTDMFQRGLNAFGRNDVPETPVERGAMAVGEGVGNAASVFAPASVVARTAQAGGMASNVARQLAANPVTQAVAGGVGGGVAQATDSPVAGMAAAMAVPLGVSAMRGMISPGGTRPNAEQRRLVDVAQAEGIPLSPGQITGSRPLRTTESVFSTLPTTAGTQAARDQAQREAYNRAVLARSGVQGENLATPDVLQAARARIGGELGDIAARNEMTVNANVMQSVQQIANDARRYLPADKARPVLNRVADFIDKIDTRNFKVEGSAYAKLDSALSAQIRNEADGNVRQVLGDLRDALRQGMDASISGADADAWNLARRQYANLMLTTRAMNQPSAATAGGNIPPAALSTAVASGPQRNYAMGRGDLNDLARVGRAFIQDAIPNSGTPERLAIQNLLTGGGLAGATMFGGGNAGQAMAAAAAGLAGPRLAQMAYYSPLMQRYMTNQLGAGLMPGVGARTIPAIAAGQMMPMTERVR